MYHIKLIKALSYMGFGVSATKKKPDVYIKDDDMAEKLIATGFFETVSTSPKTIEADKNENEYRCDGKTLYEMNISELETFATYKGISLKGIKKKDAIISKLKEELPDNEIEGIIEYGSPTMTELQG